MSVNSLMSQPLTVQTMGGSTKDDYGNTVPGVIGPPVATTGFLEQKDTIEYLGDQERSVSKWTAFLPAGTAIHPMDYINFEAQKFQVDGEPHHVYNPRTRIVSHIECKLTVTS